jgi:pimeloyl-ACP methyl ester carboxylesterase
MQVDVDGRRVFVATGGRPHAADAPLAVFLHGAGMDHSVWALQAREFACHGHNVAAVDLPGHGRSEGPPLPTIEALADWTLALVRRLGGKALLVGHSMGSLAALEAAARAPDEVAGLALVGTATKMPVHPSLLAAAAANHPDAVAMVSLWGLGPEATLGGCEAPGLWMLGGAERLLMNAPPGVLGVDLAACNAYVNGLTAAARVTAPTLLVLGERDLMTPRASGEALGKAIAGARVVVVPGAGHMLMAERPEELLAALQGLGKARAELYGRE